MPWVTKFKAGYPYQVWEEPSVSGGKQGSYYGGGYLPSQTTTPAKTTTPTPTAVATGESGGGGSSAPGFNFPTFNLNTPSLAWNPTETQKSSWLTEALKRAGLVIDPQVSSANQGYTNFSNQAEAQVGEINPQYTDMSLALANVFKNNVQGNLKESAVRRGAENSGWLPAELANAGRQETTQRSDIENQRNTVLDAIRKQVLNKRSETDASLQALEGLRGKQTDVTYADLERQARSDMITQKQGEFSNELQKAIFESGYSMDQANYLLNKFNTEANVGLGEASQALNEKQVGLQEALQNYNMQPRSTYQPAAPTYTWTDPVTGQTYSGLTLGQALNQINQTNNRGNNTGKVSINPDGSISIG